MDLDYSDLKKLKVFFFALKKSNYKPKQIPNSIVMDGALTPIDKTRCLQLLHSFPGLQDKDDNQIFEVLSNPNKVNSILGQLTYSQRNELTEILAEKPVAAEGVSEELPSGQEQALAGGETQPAGTAVGAPGGFGLPSAPYTSPRVVIHNVPHAPEPSKPEIHIANAGGGGVITGEHPLTPSSTSRRFNFRPSAAFSNTLRNSGSRIGVFFQRNVGKYFTVGRVATVVSGGIGAITGGALTNGSAIGILGGGGIGALAPSWIRSGGGARFLGRVGGGAINAGAAISNQASRLSIASPGKKVFITAILGFFLLALGVGLISSPSSQPGSSPPPQAAYPPYQPGAGSGVISCPLNKGSVTIGSKDKGGHCSPGYQTDYPCADPDTTGRATAVDIASTDRVVYLPKLNNSEVTWTIEQIDTNTDYVDKSQIINGGYSVIASAQSQGKTYRIRYVHIESPNLLQGQQVSSQTPVGFYRTRENHVHVTVQEDGVFRPGDLYFNLCK